jgi:hypothetical protein
MSTDSFFQDLMASPRPSEHTYTKTRYVGRNVPGKLWRRMRRRSLDQVDLVRIWQGSDKHIIIQFTYDGHPFRRDLGQYSVWQKWLAFRAKWYEPVSLGFVTLSFVRHRLCERSFLGTLFGDPNEKENAECLAMKKKLQREEAAEAQKIHTFRMHLVGGLTYEGRTVVLRHDMVQGNGNRWACGTIGVVVEDHQETLVILDPVLRDRRIDVQLEEVEILPEGCSRDFVTYKSLEQELKQLREKSNGAYAQEQGPVLDAMTEIWMKLPENEMDMLDVEGPQAKNIRATEGTTP